MKIHLDGTQGRIALQREYRKNKVPNKINRYHLAPWMPLNTNADGSLDMFIQAESPGPDKQSNWLPTPASGPFNLTTRIVWPAEAALEGPWRMPGVKLLK